jgi:hypothetical protein
MSLRVSNSLSGEREQFEPADPESVLLYYCGLTTSDPAHLGHARGWVHVDVMHRWLEWLGYEVRHVREDSRPCRRGWRLRGGGGGVVHRRHSPGHALAESAACGGVPAGLRARARDNRVDRTAAGTGVRLRVERLGVLRRDRLRGVRRALEPGDRGDGATGDHRGARGEAPSG